MSRSCYVCGGYLFRDVRHRKCEPKYHRARFDACDICGGLTRGTRHKNCNIVPKDYQPCAYCGRASRGAYHNSCTPVALDALAMFPDQPGVVQRRCRVCLEWFPFAAVDGDTAGTTDAWSAHGMSASGRPLYTASCRACKAERRHVQERAA